MGYQSKKKKQFVSFADGGSIELPSYERNKNWFLENKFVILTFFVAALIMCATYWFRGVYPFGDQIVLKVDLYHQYGPFHEELRSRILNHQSLFYSWEGGLGKEFYTQLAYYTTSPLSFLILLFPQGNMPEALALFILLKIAFCGAFFAYYLKESFKRNDMSIVVFGVFYAFTAFVTGYYWNVMWLDSVALFPLIALGIEKLVKEDKHLFYSITLAIVIIVNFYIAFIICIFASLYFLVMLFSNYDWKHDKKVMISRFIKFAIVSIIGGGISMFLTIPTALALGQTATSNTGFPKFEIYQNVYQLITNHFIGARPVVLARNEDLPNVYSGVLAVMLAPLYFANKRVNKKEKIGMAALLIFMLLCSCIKPLDYLIHGAHFPSNLPHRYTFIYSFIMLRLAFVAFWDIKNTKLDILNYAFIIYTCIILLTEFVLAPNISDIDRVLDNGDIVINIVAMICYIILLNIYKGTESTGYATVFTVFFVFAVAEALFSSYVGLDRTTSRDSYVKYIPATDEAVAKLNEKENGNFYRTEFRRFTTINDAALYHYRGFSQFSSLAPGGISDFIGSLGIAATGNSYRYYDPTALVDALFDVKYVMNKADDSGNGEIKNERYHKIDQIDNVWVYQNDRVLPLGFMTDSKIKNWETKDSTPFAVQNQFINDAAGVSGEMFTDVPITSLNKTFMNTRDEEGNNTFKYTLTEPANLSLEPTVTAEIVSDKDQYLFVYVDAGNAKRVKYVTNTANEDRELSAGKSLFDVGHVSKGEKITVSFALTNKGEFEKTYRKDGTVKIYAASYNDSVFQQAYDKLNQHTFNITVFKDTDITGTINAEEDGVMFTSIPYVDGWHVFVDGKAVDKVDIGNRGVIGVDITKGEHTVEFKFNTRGLVPGLAISCVSVVALVGYTIFDKKRKQKNIPVTPEVTA